MMKRTFFYSLVIATLFIAGCNNSSDAPKENKDKIKLEFKPVPGKKVKLNYLFSVNQVTSGDLTGFEMDITARGGTNENGDIVLDMTNEKIKMKGIIHGKAVSGSASGPDSLTGDAKLVALSVFSMEGNTYRSIYNNQLNKKSEVRIENGNIIDSTENKMQFLVVYPEKEIGVGDSWQKEIVLKSGNNINCSATYTLKEIHEDLAVVTIEGKLYGSGEKFGNEFSMEGKLTGIITIDITTGWPIITDVHQEFILKMGGNDIPMKYDIKCNIE